jgi:hypothetical protein
MDLKEIGYEGMDRTHVDQDRPVARFSEHDTEHSGFIKGRRVEPLRR